MTVVIRTPRTSRLSKLIDSPGGSSVGVALAKARDNLSSLEPRSLEMIAACIAEIGALQPPRTHDDLQANLLAAYRASAGVLDAAGPFDRADLCAVATSLCDLIDGAGDAADFDWRIVQVHSRALELMMALPVEAKPQRQQILDGLADVRARKLPPVQVEA